MVRIGKLSGVGVALLVLMVAGCAAPVPGTPTAVTGPTKETATVTVTAPAASPWDKKVFDRTAVENGVVALIKNSYNMDATEASCPKADQTEVIPGNTFDCTVIIAGENKTVTITVKDADGKYEVSVPN